MAWFMSREDNYVFGNWIILPHLYQRWIVDNGFVKQWFFLHLGNKYEQSDIEKQRQWSDKMMIMIVMSYT